MRRVCCKPRNRYHRQVNTHDENDPQESASPRHSETRVTGPGVRPPTAVPAADETGRRFKDTIVVRQPPPDPGPDGELPPLNQLQTAVETALGRYARSHTATPAIQPGVDADAPAIDGIGDLRHAFGQALGKGGVGKVMLGVDRDMRRSVAIKMLREEHRGDPLFLRAFLEEAILTGGLEHPNIVPVYEVGVSPELGPYYTMKRLEGLPLDQVMSGLRRGDETITERYSLGRLMEIFAQVLRAVAYAHHRRVIHCDLKPANVMVGRYGEVLVIDWGLAKVLGPDGRRQARAELWSGSPGYMSPEQALSEEVESLDERCDIWSLGAVLYEMLTLALPLADETGRITEDPEWRPIPPPSERAPSRYIPTELEATCVRALSLARDDRHPSVEALLEEIQAWLDGTRDQRRREEEAHQALSGAVEALRRARTHEIRIDGLQEQVGDAALDPDDEHALNAARVSLMAVYEAARTAVVQGLSVNPQGEGLQNAAAALYWHTFRRIFPARLPPSGDLAQRALALLESLAQVALRAIIRRGHRDAVRIEASTVAGPELSKLAAEIDDPWLSAIALVGSRQGRNPHVERLIERIRTLRQVPIFQAMNGNAVMRLAEACGLATFETHEAVFAQGDEGDALYVVLSGAVDIRRDGKRLAIMGPATCFGEIALVDAAPRSADASATEPTRCLTLTAERFHDLVMHDGAIGHGVMRVLARRLRAATEREIAYKKAQGDAGATPGSSSDG
ncbi:MAG: hypothetical protein ACI9MR_001863 [Myxococcota bacterium]|jgi:hypothetical protein